jgi:DNA polymerase I-like protein with 3'-5' exonuclease and polymerase domains
MGSVIFYNWVREVRARGVKITLNIHDEIQLRVKKENIDSVKVILQESMDKVNEKFNLAVPIKIDIAVGQNYGDTH